MENEQADAGRDGRTPSREIKFSGANGDRNIFIFPVSRIDVDRTRLIHTLLYVTTIHTYIHTYRLVLVSALLVYIIVCGVHES